MREASYEKLDYVIQVSVVAAHLALEDKHIPQIGILSVAKDLRTISSPGKVERITDN